MQSKSPALVITGGQIERDAEREERESDEGHMNGKGRAK